MSKLRLMGQNQWNCTNNQPKWEEQGLDCSAEHRMKGHIRVLKELMPDIIGGQEVNKDMQIFFKVYCQEENLPYTIIWGNMTPIIYRADKFELLDAEFFLFHRFMEGLEGEVNNASAPFLLPLVYPIFSCRSRQKPLKTLKLSQIYRAHARVSVT